MVPVKRVICINGKHIGWFMRDVNGNGSVVFACVPSEMETRIMRMCCGVLTSSVCENGKFPTDEQLIVGMVSTYVSMAMVIQMFAWPDSAIAEALSVPSSFVQMKREYLLMHGAPPPYTMLGGGSA